MSMQDSPPTVVADAPDRGRFEARQGEQLVGFLNYRRTPSTVMFDHVEVEPAHRGRGIADQIVTAAVAVADAEGLQIVPICPYVVAWMRSHQRG